MDLAILDTKEKTEKLTAELKRAFGKCGDLLYLQTCIFLFKLFGKSFAGSRHPNIWIGGRDNNRDGNFKWLLRNKEFEYTNWAPLQPDNKNGIEYCVMIWENHDYRWNDGNCLARIPYVCEKRV